MTVGGGRGDPLAVLQRIRGSRPTAVPRAGEVCELCAVEIADEHGHLVDLEGRSLLCACRACYLLFTAGGSGGLRYRAVPDRYLSFPDFRLSEEQWDSLQIPVSVAFFFVNSTLERVAAFYPGPAGATESLLALETWADLVAANPELGTLEPDVEAFLVRADRHSTDSSSVECFLVPIDACYELVGELRRLWRGFDGGSEAHGSARGVLRPGPGRAAGAMTSLRFEVVGAHAEPYAAVPTIMLRLRIEEADGRPVHTLALRGQIRIEPHRRRVRRG